MERLIAVIAVFGLVTAGLTYLVSIGFPQQRYLKYAVPLLCVVIALYNFAIAPSTTTEGFQQLGRVIYGMLALGCFVISLIAAMVIDWRLRRP